MAASAMGAANPNNVPVIFDGKQGATGATQGTGTGALSTGIGYGLNSPVIGPTAPASILAAGFNDDVQIPLWRIGTPQTEYIGAFGNGGSRDNGAGSIFPLKMVTASGAVANGAAIETGWVNRTGAAMASGQSAHGSSTAAVSAG